MIKDLFVRPTAKNISETKEAIGGVVDMILSDQETSQYLSKITSHDYYTYTHSVNVGFLAICLVRPLFQGSDKHDMHELGAGFFLHDLGKVDIPPGIINNPAAYPRRRWRKSENTRTRDSRFSKRPAN